MELLEINSEEEKIVLESLNIQENELNESVEIIKTWKKKQPHLPDFTDDFIKRMLIRNKFLIERTKEKIDNYFTLRGQNRELVAGFENFVPSKLFFMCLPFPRVTPRSERVVYLRLIDTNPEKYDFLQNTKFCLATLELGMHYDNSIGVRFIFDFEGFTFKHFLKWNPIVLRKGYNLLEEAYSWRIVELAVLNAPEFIGKILALVKLFLPTKIYERINIYQKSELLENIPKECLPAELGGTCSNLKNLLEKWDEIFENHHLFFLKISNQFSNEELRFVKQRIGVLFGLQGSFKKLTLD